MPRLVFRYSISLWTTRVHTFSDWKYSGGEGERNLSVGTFEQLCSVRLNTKDESIFFSIDFSDATFVIDSPVVRGVLKCITYIGRKKRAYRMTYAYKTLAIIFSSTSCLTSLLKIFSKVCYKYTSFENIRGSNWNETNVSRKQLRKRVPFPAFRRVSITI